MLELTLKRRACPFVPVRSRLVPRARNLDLQAQLTFPVERQALHGLPLPLHSGQGISPSTQYGLMQGFLTMTIGTPF